MNTNKVLLLAVIAAFSTGCAGNRANNGLVDTSDQ